MTELRVRTREGQSLDPVDDGHPLPIKVIEGSDVAIVSIVEAEGPDYTDFNSLTVSNSSVGLAAATYKSHKYAFLTCETATVRFRFDGATTAPTSSVGHVLSPVDVFTLNSNAQIKNIRFIRRDGIDATLRYSCGD